MNVGIIGSRSFSDYQLCHDSILDVISPRDIEAIVSGGAQGADSIGVDFAKEYNIPTQIFYPDWQKHGKGAGFIRNTRIVNHSNFIVAFWDGQSRGTQDTMQKARKKEVPVWVVCYGNNPILRFYY